MLSAKDLLDNDKMKQIEAMLHERDENGRSIYDEPEEESDFSEADI